MKKTLVPEIPQQICDKLRAAICDLRAQVDALESLVRLHEPMDILRVLQSERGRVEPPVEAVEPKPRKKARKPVVRLSDSQKAEIFYLIAAGMKNGDIAARYGVTPALISAMRNGRVHSDFRPKGV